jgi:hypothetical protein
VSSDFYATSIVPFAPIIIKICRAYTNTQEDFQDYYQLYLDEKSYREIGEIIGTNPNNIGVRIKLYIAKFDAPANSLDSYHYL